MAQGWRTDTYRSLTAQPHTHVFTVDYRGFGKSTGSPTEAGIITDGIALADYVVNTVEIKHDKIVILGQSLGTAVATAVGLHFATTGIKFNLLPQRVGGVSSVGSVDEVKQVKVFAGIVLVAPFTSLPSLLLSYRIGGLVPILRPLRPYPYLTSLVEGYILDKWPTAIRLAAYVKALAGNAEIGVAERMGREMGGVQIVHAVNDADISVEQGRMLFKEVVPGSQGTFEGIGETAWKEMGSPRVRLEIVEHGGEFCCFLMRCGVESRRVRTNVRAGHNRVVTYAPVALAVMRAFEGQ